ncbi:MAG: glycosyltransferase family 2 protein [Gammaproteobacteria bacterium]
MESGLSAQLHTSDAPAISVVIPVFNEAANVEALSHEINSVLSTRGPFEVLFVDDGSEDQTWEILQTLTQQAPSLRPVRHTSRCGQSAALRTGVDAAKHELIVTLDGDGQNDPRDIPKLLDVIDADRHALASLLIIGHRVKRQDSSAKRLASRVANAVRSRVLGDATPDTGCGLKVFSRNTFLRLPYFDHMHRFLPALIRRAGGRVISVPISHRPRLGGQSKYGIFDRLGAGIVDLLGVAWLIRRCPPDYHLIAESTKPTTSPKPANRG